MKRKPSIIVIACAVALLALAWPAPARLAAAQAAPKLVLPVTSYDFGETWRGERLVYIFPIRNEGADALEIKELEPS